MDPELVERALRFVIDVIGFEDQGITVMIDLPARGLSEDQRHVWMEGRDAREGSLARFYAWTSGNGFGAGGEVLGAEVGLVRYSLASLLDALIERGVVERVRTVAFRFGDPGTSFWEQVAGLLPRDAGPLGGRLAANSEEHRTRQWVCVQKDLQSLCGRARTVICLNVKGDWWRDFSRCAPWDWNDEGHGVMPNHHFLKFPLCQRVITDRDVYLHWGDDRQFRHASRSWADTVQFWGMFPAKPEVHTVTSLIRVSQSYPFESNNPSEQHVYNDLFDEHMANQMEDRTSGPKRVSQWNPFLGGDSGSEEEEVEEPYPRDQVHYYRGCALRPGMAVRGHDTLYTGGGAVVRKNSGTRDVRDVAGAWDVSLGHDSRDPAPEEFIRCQEEMQRFVLLPWDDGEARAACKAMNGRDVLAWRRV